MTQQHHQNHATWECKYHVVFIPKYRKKTIFGVIKKRLGDVFHELARRRESKIEEGHLMPDHVHMLISIPPKYSVAEVIGFMKGKSSIWIAQNVERKARNFTGHKFWARGYFVSTVGRDEEMTEPTSRTKRCRLLGNSCVKPLHVQSVSMSCSADRRMNTSKASRRLGF